MSATSLFRIDLFEIGDMSLCLYSWFCPRCALASARTNLDGSECFFNFWCLPCIPFRWLVRSSYNIGNLNDCWQDILYTCFCPCCSVNQILQTTIAKGIPVADAGKAFNTNSFSIIKDIYDLDRFQHACCCLPCIVGDVMSHSTGMNYWLACCCMSTNICAARNIVRYQYRLKNSDEIMDECCFPYSFCIFTFTIGLFPLFWGSIVDYVLAFVEPILTETSVQRQNTTKRYLVGFEPQSLQAVVLSEQHQEEEFYHAYAILSN